MAVTKKHSKKRDAILREMLATTRHPGAQWVHERLKARIPDLSLGTVYRNIGLFVQEGLLRPLGVINGEERFDAHVEPHPHRVCISCGRIEDVPCPNEALLKRLHGKNAGGPGGFQIDFRKTVFYGVCPHCSDQGT
ncbi:MAG: transcriptional repressor [Spirochaetia bacterium]|jgi:Fur family peroxide stress response transcriptional regulator|nr:transcriptional repressor [Spirochaetia bacterium]